MRLKLSSLYPEFFIPLTWYLSGMEREGKKKKSSKEMEREGERRN
jgi:hypothetical protein